MEGNGRESSDFCGRSKRKIHRKNTNLIEVKVIKDLVGELIELGYSNDEIIVITQFVKQERLLQKKLKGALKAKKIGTIHKFQGQEAPVVIMSTVVQGNDSTTFIGVKPNLLNVAISRAKRLFIMVGSSKKLKILIILVRL
ncbi:MAG: ATP-binding domain-containing protein [Nitrospiraceae bacterium]|nr:ATP-binding domain-containing protein [Nitrospiraceae bacterium]